MAEQVFTRRDGQRRLAPEVRASLAKGPRTDLGDLLLLDHFSVSADWAVQDLDLLLLGEAVTRAAEAGPCFVATAPSLLRSSRLSAHDRSAAPCRVPTDGRAHDGGLGLRDAAARLPG